MHGNVKEWVEDSFHEYYNEALVNGSAWQAIETDVYFRVLRGGSWMRRGRYVRSAYRDWNSPGNRFSYVGFRLSYGQQEFKQDGGSEEQVK